MAKRKNKTSKKETKKEMTFRLVSCVCSLISFIYILLVDFSIFSLKSVYIPIEVLFILLVISDYYICKSKRFNYFDFIIIVLNSLMLGYILSIEIIILPLTIKGTNSSYIYKMVYSFLINYEMTLIPIFLVLGGAFVYPSIKDLLNKNKRGIYLFLLTIGIILIFFGLFYSRVCTLIDSYI